MRNPTITLIKQRVSANRFDASHLILSDSEVETLTCPATRAPTAYNLQNWRFMGLASRPMVGFDTQGVAHQFGLGSNVGSMMLVAVGRAAPGSGPQKPRRPIAEALEIS